MAQEAAPPPEAAEARGCAQRLRTILIIAIAVYVVLGIITTLAFAFLR